MLGCFCSIDQNILFSVASFTSSVFNELQFFGYLPF